MYELIAFIIMLGIHFAILLYLLHRERGAASHETVS